MNDLMRSKLCFCAEGCGLEDKSIIDMIYKINDSYDLRLRQAGAVRGLVYSNDLMSGASGGFLIKMKNKKGINGDNIEFRIEYDDLLINNFEMSRLVKSIRKYYSSI